MTALSGLRRGRQTGDGIADLLKIEATPSQKTFSLGALLGRLARRAEASLQRLAGQLEPVYGFALFYHCQRSGTGLRVDTALTQLALDANHSLPAGDA